MSSKACAGGGLRRPERAAEPARSRPVGALALCIGLLLVTAGCAHGPRSADLRSGSFPDLVVQDLVSADPGGALGVRAGQGFRLSEIPGEVLLVEFFSSRCPTCQRQAPQLEGLFREVSSGMLAGRVRVLAIGAGDSRRDLEAFQKDQRVSYPMAPDPWFELYGQLGYLPRSPVTIFLRKEAGRWVQVEALPGRVEAPALLDRAKRAMEGPGGASAPAPAARTYDPPLGLDDAQQRARALALLVRTDASVRDVAAVALDGGHRVYRALGADGRPAGLYARIASRDPICDVCHAVHFLLAFDEAGTVRGFESIHVSKVGNELLTPEEEALLRSRLVGRKLEALRFDPTVDSVTGATLSASVLFDEARRTAELLSRLHPR